jgi:hypothetical protein
MKIIHHIAFLAIFLMALPVQGQKIKVTQGDIKDLKGLTQIKLVYDYSDLGVGKFEKEADYVAEKVTEKNEDEPGSGDAWKEDWYGDREEQYEPKFEELLNKYATWLEAGKEVDAPVILHVHTKFIEPGFNVGVARKPAYIDLELFFEKDGELLVSMLILKSPGSGGAGFDYDHGYRISEAYAKAAKSLAKYLDKNLN